MRTPEEIRYEMLRTDIKSDIRDLNRRLRHVELATARLVGYAAAAAAGGGAAAQALLDWASR